MYSNTALYYLNQMGIRPWIKRSTSLSGIDEGNVADKDSFKLFVFISSTLSIKAKSLLKQMLSYINLDEQELTIIPIPALETIKNIHAQIERQAPLAILVLGLNRDQIESNLFTCPVIISSDLDYVLVNPIEKRKIFKDLNQINLLIT